jgi:uncharacterized protein (TIGR02145 family)
MLRVIFIISFVTSFSIYGVTQIIQPFNVRFSASQKGGIKILSNIAITCNSTNSNCSIYQNQIPPNGNHNQDGGITMGYVDVDMDASTWMSSSDSLNLPIFSEISWAGLYWSSRINSNITNYTNRNQVRIKVDDGAYVNLTADNLLDLTSIPGNPNFSMPGYYCFKDITSIVQPTNGKGRFTLANMVAQTGSNNLFGAWSIVVVYKNSLQSTRNLTVFDGMAYVSNGNNLDIPITGFTTPSLGPVSFEFGIVAYEGDRNIQGDRLQFNGNGTFFDLPDPLRNSNDFFNSSITSNGTLTPYRDPGYNNTLGLDVGMFNPNNSNQAYLPNNATSATIRVTTTQDAILPRVITSSIDILETFDISATNSTICAGQSTTLSVQSIDGLVSTLNCDSATNTGTLTAGTAASGVSSSVPYTGGNGGTHNGQTVTSTGVTGLTATLAAGTFATGAGSLTYTITGTPSAGGTASFALNIGGKTCTLTRTVILPVGTISTLSCGTATNTGILTAGAAASGVSSSVPYTGGNGGNCNGQTVASTGVTGLTATLAAGTFVNGNGSLTYSITGTPSGGGTASFALNIGNSSCILNFSVDNTQNNNSTHSCGTQNIHNPSLSYGNLTDQDGNTYKTIVIGTQEWMAENLKVSEYRNGDLIPIVTNGNTWSGLNTGASCFYNNDQNISCPNGKLYNWYAVSDSRNICPQGWHIPSDNEWNTLISYLDPSNVPNADGIQSISAGSTLKSMFSMDGTTPVPNSTNESGMSAQMNGFRYEDGNFYDMNSNLLWWSSTERDINSAWFRSLNYSGNFVDRRSYNKKDGFSVRCLKDEPLGMINTLDCNNYVFTEDLTQGTLTQSANLLVSYTGGNGLSFDSQIWNSTGVLGLTATITAGTFLNGSGNLSYTILGTPQNYGTATFNITIGGMSCFINLTVNPTSSIYPPNFVSCNNTTAIVDVTNPTTGKTWMDRNLGASQVATSSTDANSYGDLYQWGRFSDGHQCRNSSIENMTSSLNVPSNNSFFIVSSYPNDWRWPQNNDLWQGVNGLNNPCPIGYRIPTNTELVNEISSWSISNSNGAFTSPLKLIMAGIRNSASGSIEENEFSGYYWSSSPATIGAGGGVTTYYNSSYLYFNSSDASTSAVIRADGMSIRCIKD